MPKVCLRLANTSQMMLRVDDLAGEDAEGVEHRAVALQGEDARGLVGVDGQEGFAVVDESRAFSSSCSCLSSGAWNLKS